jgi:UDP-2,3-diacylglucosamine pyrophosphatase LpxH
MTAMRRATRVIVISDLHLGGEAPWMMSCPDRLADFIARLPARLADGEDLELVINGDFVDFLSVPPLAGWTPDPALARAKLERTMLTPPFAQVFDALGRHLAGGHRLTLLIGNHDVEMALPSAQEALLARLDATPHRVLLFDDGRAYRIGGALIEHGNRYDGANANDWNGVRTIASAHSRGEAPSVALEVSAGSVIVEKVINPLKVRYPFVDLLQPQGELVALLLVAFEPALVWHVATLARLIYAQRLAAGHPDGRGIEDAQQLGAPPAAPVDAELAAAFGDVYAAVAAADAAADAASDVGLGELISLAWASRRDGLAGLLERGEPVPPERLNQIRLVMRRLLLDDRSDRADGPTEQYGEAARHIIERSGGRVATVVMGHTHLARHVGPADRASYINSGTWIDVLRVPAAALDEGAAADAALVGFLRDLKLDRRARPVPTWAELRVDGDGQVTAAALRRGTE